ncbi:MAG: BON domain-containing protein [Cyanobacteria bacterium P01_D01_bin.116]
MKYLLLFTGLCALSGCAQTIFTGAGFLGGAAREERSLGDNIDDQAINAEIHHFMVKSDVNQLLSDINVRVHEGRVLLTGRTKSADVALEAVRLSWLAGGVREVINEIQVGEEGTNILNYAQDNFIETQIEARLIGTKTVKAVNFTVEVIDGTAYLLGVASSDQERRDAAAVASVTRGVKRVISYVRLRNNPDRLQKVGKLREQGINRN